MDASRRVWLVTGASRGIGGAVTKDALAAGDAVVATSRHPEGIVKQLGDRPDLLPLALDVTNPVSVDGAVGAAVARFGRIDVLVNNAGFSLVGAIEETSAEDVRRIYETNVFGLLAVTRAVLPHMRARRSGRVVNLSSLGGYQSGAGFGIYCSTKFAVEAISEALHEELAPLGIAVTIVEPGYFRTGVLGPGYLVDAKPLIADYEETAGKARAAASAANMHQPGDPAKLARALVDLVRSDAPPLRIAFGKDTVAVIEAKNAFVAEELRKWRSVSTSTDFAS